MTGRALAQVAARAEGVAAWAGVAPISTRRVYCGVGEVSIYVRSEVRGAGLGSYLLRSVIEASEQAGYRTGAGPGRCFGTTEWRGVVYPEHMTLFGDIEAPKADGVPDMLLELYVSRLKAIFPCVATPRLIRDTKQKPLYHLLWAGPHAKGKQGAEYILGYGKRLAKKRRL